jgi:hypothetical protein
MDGGPAAVAGRGRQERVPLTDPCFSTDTSDDDDTGRATRAPAAPIRGNQGRIGGEPAGQPITERTQG